MDVNPSARASPRGHPDAPSRVQGRRQAPSGKSMKAQAWSFDFMASVTVFFLVVITLFFVWNYTTYQNTEQMVFNEMENKALTTADTLIRTKGFPEDWNASNVQMIGLADEENVLDQEKILAFVGMDYSEAKRLMGVPSYQFFFQITYLNGSQASLSGTDLVLGIDPTGLSNTTAVVPVERNIVFDHRVARLRFLLWR